MKAQHSLSAVFEQLRKDLRTFIDLSIEEEDISWAKWMSSLARAVSPTCWEVKKCTETGCPAYKNECGRCWLIAGTMCGGEPQGVFAKKYLSCKNCEIYQKVVYGDPVTELQEHLIVLVHSLRTKQHQLQEMATTDPLTGLHNRRFLDLVIPREVAACNRSKKPLYVIMIDINHFKRINDSRGHLHGDYILKECATVLRDSIRDADLLIRFGGDEFLVVAANNSDRNIQSLIDRIHERIVQWNHRHTGDSPLSISIGVSALKDHATIDEAISQADRNMYLDKERSRQQHSTTPERMPGTLQ